jgi:hypothetical protein
MRMARIHTFSTGRKEPLGRAISTGKVGCKRENRPLPAEKERLAPVQHPDVMGCLLHSQHSCGRDAAVGQHPHEPIRHAQLRGVKHPTLTHHSDQQRFTPVCSSVNPA